MQEFFLAITSYYRSFLFKYFRCFVVLMLTHEMLGQIEILREQGVIDKKISESFDISASEANYNYNFYILPFSETFDSIVKELKLYELVFYKNDCRELFYRVLSRVKKCTKFRNVQLLIPSVVYTVFRAKGVTIKSLDFYRYCYDYYNKKYYYS